MIVACTIIFSKSNGSTYVLLCRFRIETFECVSSRAAICHLPSALEIHYQCYRLRSYHTIRYHTSARRPSVVRRSALGQLAPCAPSPLIALSPWPRCRPPCLPARFRLPPRAPPLIAAHCVRRRPGRDVDHPVCPTSPPRHPSVAPCPLPSPSSISTLVASRRPRAPDT